MTRHHALQKVLIIQQASRGNKKKKTPQQLVENSPTAKSYRRIQYLPRTRNNVYGHVGTESTSAEARRNMTYHSPLLEDRAGNHLEVHHAVLLVLRTEARLRPEMSTTRLLLAPRRLAPRALNVHHVRQLVQATSPPDAIRVVSVTSMMRHRVQR